MRALTLKTNHGDIEVLSGAITSGSRGGCIVIPATLSRELDSAVLGDLVKSCADAAEQVHAEEMADFYFRNGFRRNPMRRYDYQCFLDEIGKDVDLFEKFRGKSEDIDELLELIDEAKSALAVYAEYSKTKKQRRAQTGGSKYAEKFLAVGRRDGFKCAHCGATENLELDHIHPIAYGGDGSLENLQLLCKHHNCVKGDSLEWRVPEQSDKGPRG